MRLDLERKKKKELWEDTDYLKQVDRQDGWKVVGQYEGQNVKNAEKEKHQRLNALAEKKSARFAYLRRLALFCLEKLKTIDWPSGWEYDAVPTHGSPIRVYGRGMSTKEGIAVIVKNNQGNVFIRAVLATFEPEIDLKNAGILSVQAENTVDSAKGLLLSDRDAVTGLPKTKSGIIVAN